MEVAFDGAGSGRGEEIAKSKLLRPLGQNQPFGRSDVKAGDSFLLYETASRRSAPERRGPSAILDIWRRCRTPATDFHGGTWSLKWFGGVGDMASPVFGKMGGGDVAQMGQQEGASELSTGSPDAAAGGSSDSKVSPPSLSVQVPPRPLFLVQRPSPPSLSVHAPPLGSSFDKKCTHSPEPGDADELH